MQFNNTLNIQNILQVSEVDEGTKGTHLFEPQALLLPARRKKHQSGAIIRDCDGRGTWGKDRMQGTESSSEVSKSLTIAQETGWEGST